MTNGDDVHEEVEKRQAAQDELGLWLENHAPQHVRDRVAELVDEYPGLEQTRDQWLRALKEPEEDRDVILKRIELTGWFSEFETGWRFQDEPLMAYGRIGPITPLRRSAILGLLAFLVLTILFAIVFLTFNAFGENYVIWYAKNGTLISLATALFGLAVALDEIPELVSAHPYSYIAACTHAVTVPSKGLSAALSKSASARYPKLLAVYDHALLTAFLVVVGAWFFVISPMQYVVFLVAGVPARRALRSSLKGWYRIWRFPTIEQWYFGAAPKSQPLRKGEEEMGFSKKPVTMTTAIAGAMLFVAGKFV